MKKIFVVVLSLAILLSVSALASVKTSFWAGGEFPNGFYSGLNLKFGNPLFADLQIDLSSYGNSTTYSHRFGIGAMLNNFVLSIGLGKIYYNDNDIYNTGYWKIGFFSDSLSSSLDFSVTEKMNYGSASASIDARFSCIGVRLNGFFNVTPPANEYCSVSGDISLGSNRIRLFIGSGRSYFLSYEDYYRVDNMSVSVGLRIIEKNSSWEWAIQENLAKDRYGDKETPKFLFNISFSF